MSVGLPGPGSRHGHFAAFSNSWAICVAERASLCVLESTPAADEARFLAGPLRIRLTDPCFSARDRRRHSDVAPQRPVFVSDHPLFVAFGDAGSARPRYYVASGAGRT